MKSKLQKSPRPAVTWVWAGLLALVMGISATTSYAHNNSHQKQHNEFSNWYGGWSQILRHWWKHRPSHDIPYSEPAASCGYAVRSGVYAVWPGGFQGWVDIKNISGETATDFEVLLDIGDATITHGYLADYQQAEGGYLVSAPSWLRWQTIPPGDSYRFQFNASSQYEGVTPYVISINGEPCDLEAPEITLNASEDFFVDDGTLTLTAAASDNALVRRVVFEKNGEVVGEDSEAPFELEVDVTEALNGFHLYTATAYDPSGNMATSGAERVFVSIDNKFLGTAPDAPVDYDNLLAYFNQITPANAGKWGSVEAERDVMNWGPLDTAYNFAQENGIAFKFHTLIWGQQQPDWLAALPPEEQLAEIEEWMAALAERYPDLTMIDVVNEPLHAPPSYAGALGGAGETGWDWVIKSFELAREYFPEAQLILNDYQILHLPEFTQDYLDIITLLQERDLIDAIGLQAHFLERADLDVVAANLNTLAATGLPIYISEFDLNFADDARHANAFRDLFTLFWENPAVAGVTHWGFLEGHVWRTDAYLVRSDGTTRPAFDWLLCYLGGGTGCTVPDYIPAGWQGDEYGVALEAELYDNGEGVVALGNVVAYTDDGDWIAYSDVSFQDSWDTFWVTYAKGNTETGSISIHLDSLESDPLLTVELPSTGGWGNSDTLEVALPPVTGDHDVYIRFNDVGGVANVDNLRFGTPRPTSGVNLVVDGGFEGSSLTGWQSWNGSTLELTTGQAYAGGQSLLASNRPDANQYAVYNLTSVVSPGTTYAVSAQAMHMGDAPDTLRLAAKVQCTDETAPEGHNTYPWLQNLSNVPAGEWTTLSANLVIPDCDVVDVAIFFEGTSAGVDVYLDEVTVTPPSQNLVANGDFELNAAGWSSWNGSTLIASSGQAYNSYQSLLATDRPDTAQYAVYSLTGLVSAGNTYSVSAQALHTGAAADTLRLAAKVQCSDATVPEGHNTYPWLQNLGGVEPYQWTELSGELVIPDCDVVDVAIFFEGTSAGVDVYLDNVAVLQN